MPCTMYNNNNLMDEISNFRDKCISTEEYGVKNTNISTLKIAKKHRIVIQI